MNKKCMDCGRSMTWAEQRVQFKRLVMKGCKDAPAMLPRCQKCVTKLLPTPPTQYANAQLCPTALARDE